MVILMKRLPFVDSIKGFTIICVVLGHVANGYIGEGISMGIYYSIYNFVYAFHMPLFFMISGFLFDRAYFTDGILKKERVKAQIINLICLYFIYCLLLGGSKTMFGEFVNNQVTVMDLFRIPIQPIQQYWYLYVLVICYIIFRLPVIYRLNSAIIFPVTLGLCILSHWIPLTFPCEIKRLLYHILFFYAGITLSKTNKIRIPKFSFLLLLPLIVLLYFLFWNNEKELDDILLVNITLGLSCSLFFWEMFRQFKALCENRFLLFVGKYSLEIYLLHTFIVTANRTMFHKLNINNEFLIILLSTSTGVLIPIFCSFVCKKTHLYRTLFSPYKGKTGKD